MNIHILTKLLTKRPQGQSQDLEWGSISFLMTQGRKRQQYKNNYGWMIFSKILLYGVLLAISELGLWIIVGNFKADKAQYEHSS